MDIDDHGDSGLMGVTGCYNSPAVEVKGTSGEISNSHFGSKLIGVGVAIAIGIDENSEHSMPIPIPIPTPSMEISHHYNCCGEILA